MECAYLFDDDGTQMYCTICSGGEEVFMCDAENCAKVYCAPCIEKLCGLPELERVRMYMHVDRNVVVQMMRYVQKNL